jgi:hypothetical protein
MPVSFAKLNKTNCGRYEYVLHGPAQCDRALRGHAENITILSRKKVLFEANLKGKKYLLCVSQNHFVKLKIIPDK